MTMELTEQQQQIVTETGSCVVVATPGSGKTRVMSERIRRIVPDLPDYQGVIAISFTNKASRELRQRCLREGFDAKASWFGTIDSFCNSEIIVPFGRHFFGLPSSELVVVEKTDLSKEQQDSLTDLPELNDLSELSEAHFVALGKLYVDGKVILGSFGAFALSIVQRSSACQRYLKARFKHIFVDEYQDSDMVQHVLFCKLHELGLYAMAVGDIDQSIFKWAGKNPLFLQDLAGRDDFTLYSMDKNHRCHPSIVNYATQLLGKTTNILTTDECCVHEKKIDGTEKDIGTWLAAVIPLYEELLGIENRCGIAILVRSRRTAGLVATQFTLPHRYTDTTPLDSTVSLWGSVFRRLLFFFGNPHDTRYELLEEFGALDFSIRDSIRTRESISKARKFFLADSIHKCKSAMVDIATILYPKAENISALSSLDAVLTSSEHRKTFLPSSTNEVEMMTFHKAKGLEFELVFHLDLYQYIFPMYNGDEKEDLNIHYVGITRAKKCVVLCHSARRHKSNGEITEAIPSVFLSRNGVQRLRQKSPY